MEGVCVIERECVCVRACKLVVALLVARQKECVCFPLFHHRSSACMCVHIRKHTCDVKERECVCAAYVLSVCCWVRARKNVCVCFFVQSPEFHVHVCARS